MSIAVGATLTHKVGIPYAGTLMSTDYYSCREDEQLVTWEYEETGYLAIGSAATFFCICLYLTQEVVVV